jgi:hypothetical protein
MYIAALAGREIADPVIAVIIGVIGWKLYHNCTLAGSPMSPVVPR